MTALRTLLLAALLLPACRATSASPSGPVAFATVASNTMGGPNQPARQAVRTREAWNRFWARHGAAVPELSDLDFERDMLVIVALGARPSGGHSVEVLDVREEGGFLRVRARETRPAQGALTTTVVTTPYAVVRVPRRSGPVSVSFE